MKIILGRSILIILTCFVPAASSEKPRVIVTTDINIGKGDPDDRQSLAHLLWYADQLDLRGIVVDRPDANGAEACRLVYDCYQQDFNCPGTLFREMGFPKADYFLSITCTNSKDAKRLIIQEARRIDPSPLWLLAWGNLKTIAATLNADPNIVSKIRLISIGTNLLSPMDGGDGQKPNWNGPGRREIWGKYPQLWWLEIDCTYNGMFEGDESVALKESLAKYGGKLGRHIKDTIETVDWANNFRAGDTPSVLYLIDPNHNIDDPTQPSWAGRYVKPFPRERPNYWTDIPGDSEWNFADPAETWTNARQRYDAAKQTLLEHRPQMYAALLDKVKRLYSCADTGQKNKK
jgi:hypothetical protein